MFEKFFRPAAVSFLEISDDERRRRYAVLFDAPHYKQFTEGARKVMLHAHHEACLRGEETLDTQHILFGLLQESGGIAVNVLTMCGLTHLLLRKGMTINDSQQVTITQLPHASDTERLIEDARAVALDLNHAVIGTEHLLLGLIRNPACVAFSMLQDLGVTAQGIREEIYRLLRRDINGRSIVVLQVAFPPEFVALLERVRQQRGKKTLEETIEALTAEAVSREGGCSL